MQIFSFSYLYSTNLSALIPNLLSVFKLDHGKLSNLCQNTQGSAVSKASWTAGFFILFFSKRTLNLQCHVDTGKSSSLTVIE